MFDRDSRSTITESVVESADSAVESADYWSRPTGTWPSGYGPLAFEGHHNCDVPCSVMNNANRLHNRRSCC